MRRWEVSLGEITTMKYGKLPPKETCGEEGFPIFTGYRVSGFSNEYLYEEPEVIVVARGVGGTGDVKMSPAKSWITNLSIVLSIDPLRVDKQFLLYRLGQEPLKEKLNTGAAQAQITIENLRPYSITIPALDVQRRISSTLSAYDDLIENNRRRMALLEESARLLFRKWFVSLRFPGHEHTRITDGVPEGWERVPLENVLLLQRGFDLPSQARQKGEVPIYGSTGVLGYHSSAKASAPGVVTGRSGTLGDVQYVVEDYWPLNTALWVKEFKKVPPLFALFLLREMDLKQYNGGSSVPTLDRKTVHKVEILLPSRLLLSSFDEFAAGIFTQIKNLNLQNQKLRTARDLLLPRLMSGEIAI